jgi:hypothetical protein
MFWQVLTYVAAAIGVATAVLAVLKAAYAWGQDAGRRQAEREAKERAEAEERAIMRQELEEMLQAVNRKRRWRRP